MKTPEELGRDLAAKTHLGFDQEARELAAALIAEAVMERDAEWQQEMEPLRNENARLNGGRGRIPVIRQSPDGCHETSGKWYVADAMTDLFYLHADGTWRFSCVDCLHESKADAEKAVKLFRRRQRANT